MYVPKILFVTDNESEATKILRWLNSWGYDVNRTKLGDKTLIKSDLLDHDTVLIDLHHTHLKHTMEIINTLTFQGNSPILFITSYGDENFFNHPNFSVIRRPFNPLKLKCTLELYNYKYLLSKTLINSKNKYTDLMKNCDKIVLVVDNTGTIQVITPCAVRYGDVVLMI